MLTCYRLRFSGALICMASALFLLCATRANAQTAPEPGKVARSVVFTEQAAYRRGARMLLSATENYVIPDPRGRYALIECNEDTPPDPLTGEAAPGVARLLLYDGVTGRVKTVWQQDAADQSEWKGGLMSISWLSQTDTALAVVMDRGEPRQKSAQPDKKSDISLLLIRASLGSGGVRRLLQGENSMMVHASPRRPLAMIGEITQDSTAPDGTRELDWRWFSINEHGTLVPALPLGTHAIGGSNWDSEGATTYFIDHEPIAAPAANGSATPADKPEMRYQVWAFNILTQTITPIDKLPLGRPKPDVPVDGPLRLVRGALSAVPPVSEGAQPPVKPEKIAPLWLVRADKEREGLLPTATLIAPDAQESFLLADNSAVLYVADGAVYAVPLTRQPRPDFDAQYRKLLQQATVSQARQIGLALIGCAQDNSLKYPPSDSYATVMAPYVNNNDIFNNPATGQPGFTYLLNGDAMTTIGFSATTAMGYLAGPGGRAVLYADGHAVWEDAPPPPSSP